LAAKKKDQESERRERLAAITRVASRFEGFRPAGEVLTKVRAVPTIFPMLNSATRCGGWPIERIGLVHGESQGGKTNLVLGLGKSFLERDSFFCYIDSEFATPAEYVAQMMGEYNDHPGFQAMRPNSYEETRDAVRRFVDSLAAAKDKGELDKDTSALLVVDSIRKLIPLRMVEALEKEAEKVGLDGMRGMAGSYRAALNAAWMDELTGLLFNTGTAMVIIARERKRLNAKPFEKEYEIGGGESLVYESSIACRVTRTFVKDGDDIVGERNNVRIWKSKVGSKVDGKWSDCGFHTSNGIKYPLGFDRARDVLEMSLACGVVDKKGGRTWVTVDAGPLGAGEVFGNSEAEAAQYLRTAPDARAAIEELATAKFVPTEGEL